MDFKYLRLRLRTFRREYFELTNEWFKNSWSWLWRFTIDNFKYLYQGEIHQIKFLSHTIEQQNKYIEFLQSDTFNQPGDIQEDPVSRPGKILGALGFILKLVLLPVSFIIYWIRRSLRILFIRRFVMSVSDLKPTEDMSLDTSFNGKARSLFLVPRKRKFYPRGLVKLRYTLSVKNHPAEPVLYIDPGMGFISEYSIPLPFNAENDTQELLLELPPHCRLLQLQIADKKVDLELSDVSMREINFFLAAWYLKWHYKFGINEILHTLFIRKLPGVRRIRSSKISYPVWHQRYCVLSGSERLAIRRYIESMGSPPRFTIFISANNEKPAFLEQTFKSIVAQYYPWWELIVTCNEKPDAHITNILNHYERKDERIRIHIDSNKAQIGKDISEAIQKADSTFTLFVEQGDLLAEHSLYLIAYRVRKAVDVEMYYSDYDLIDQYGIQSDPCFKTEWNYDFFLGKNYLQYLTFYRTESLRDLLKEDKIDPFSEAAKLNLLFIEGKDENQILHIPYVLLHHRRRDPESENDHQVQHKKQDLQAHLQGSDQDASVISVRGGFQIKRNISNAKPLVSLVVLTRDRVALLANCMDGLLENTSYTNLEVIIVDNGSKEEATLEYLDAINADERVKVIKHDIEFNFSELNNFGVSHTSGEYLGLINNDISVINPDWLDEMMGHLIRPEVGIVGAKLLYENDTIQHAGVIVGLGGVAGHAFRHEPRHARGYDDRLILCQELSCVTAACLLTRKELYNKVDGLDEVNLRVAFNDVDYCLKVRDKGYKVIWTPFAELYHLESASRGHDLSRDNIHRWQREYEFMRNKWRYALEWDHFYNPNLAITDEDFSLAQPPRLIHPWDRYGF